MIDLHPALYQMLKEFGRVELEFPDTKASFPVITLCEISNIPELVVDGVELRSAVTYQVDVWDNGKNPERVEDLANAISHKLTENYFFRVMGRGLKDPSGLWRKTMYFRTLIGK